MFTVSFDDASATLLFNGRPITISVEPPRPDLPIEPLHIGILNCENENCGHVFIINMDVPVNRKRFHSGKCRSDCHHAVDKAKS
ncbi:MAG: hypothetical protein PHC88_05370 [Terrimicrobiaceae bacterium]|nr:hypothetical protein [Terrimicrobiaceae bacterium]